MREFVQCGWSVRPISRSQFNSSRFYGGRPVRCNRLATLAYQKDGETAHRCDKHPMHDEGWTLVEKEVATR